MNRFILTDRFIQGVSRAGKRISGPEGGTDKTNTFAPFFFNHLKNSPGFEPEGPE
jgi:hypothetical protein